MPDYNYNIISMVCSHAKHNANHFARAEEPINTTRTGVKLLMESINRKNGQRPRSVRQVPNKRTNEREKKPAKLAAE